MAASAVIGALRVNLGLNSGSFRSGLKKSSSGLDKFAKAAKVAFAAVAAGATVAFASVASAANRADGAMKSSKALGLRVEELGRLQHAAELSGVTFTQLSTGIKRASQTIGQALDGMSNEGTRTLENLGVSLTGAGGKVRSVSEVFGDVADRFSKMPDGVEKTAIAIALFGRSGSDMIPMLNAGREGLAKMGDEAERLGLVFNEDTGRASELFNDNITRLTRSMTGLWNRVLQNVIPGMANLTTKFVESVMEGGKFDGVIRGVSMALNGLVRGLAFAFEHLKDLYDLFKIWVGAQIMFFVASLAGSFITLAKTMRTAGITMALITKITRTKITLFLLLAAAIAKATGKYEDMVGWISEFSKTAFDALPESVKTGIEDFSGALKGLIGDIEGADQAANQSLATYLRIGSNAANSFNVVKTSVQGVGVAIDENQKKASNLSNGMQSAFSNVGNTMRGLIDKTKTWQDVLKSALDSLIKIGIQQISTTGFAGGNSGAGGNIIGSILKGFMGGFRDGGEFTVGGTGGIDSQPVSFMATPNETVRVSKPGQQMNGQGRMNVDIKIFGAIGNAELEQLVRQGVSAGINEAAPGIVGRAVVATQETFINKPLAWQG